MQIFQIKERGYDVSEVDKALAKIRAEYEEKLRAKEDEFAKTKINFTTQLEQKNNQIFNLEQKVEKLHEIINDYSKREERTKNILDATNKLKMLEAQRLRILYNKWRSFLDDLKNKVKGVVPTEEIAKLSQDFDCSLKLIVDSSVDVNENQSYAKNVLSRMNGKKPLNSNKIITKKYVSKITRDSTEEHFVEEEIVLSEPSQAEQFLNGGGVKIPLTLGIGKEVLNIPGKQQKESKGKSFSIEEALTPKESLSEIMTVFNLDD